MQQVGRAGCILSLLAKRLYGKWISHARATTAHLNAPFDAKHHSVSTIGKLTVAAQAFLCDEAPLSGKDVVECVDRLLLENGMSPFGAKIVFVSQLGLSTSFCATSRKSRFIVKNFKRCSFWKDFRLDEWFWRNRDAQRSKNLQSFWCWVKGNFLYTLKVWTIWSIGAILTFWDFCFNICFQEGHSSPKLCCKFHIHILALSLI